MLVKKSAERIWKATETSGVDRSLFRNNELGGRSSVLRLQKNARVPRHAHHGQEEVVVLSGSVLIGGVELGEGDYLFTQAGEEHDVLALTDAIIFVSSQKSITVVE
jgi:quercetin dioxygenase-like cupin family protein